MNFGIEPDSSPLVFSLVDQCFDESILISSPGFNPLWKVILGTQPVWSQEAQVITFFGKISIEGNIEFREIDAIFIGMDGCYIGKRKQQPIHLEMSVTTIFLSSIFKIF